MDQEDLFHLEPIKDTAFHQQLYFSYVFQIEPHHLGNILLDIYEAMMIYQTMNHQ